ncbi:hypothetical protein [Alkalihalobacillus sp. CinArs1]|uniref:hypothetical protein n=1 Tax=Alkalihalobacillus sp. CinArs1 TaxID=2995314 RepID=UPI0022DD8D26|nr:hypothetical protein [Alkalihalobacillus sp. CinArs1]
MIQADSWRQELQMFVDQVVKRVYALPKHQRSLLTTLEFIEAEQSSLNRDLFPSQGCYYIKLAQIMDHLIQGLTEAKDKEAWFCEFWRGFDEIQGTEFSLNSVIVHQTDKELTVQKYVVDLLEDQVNQFQQNVIECSKHMFKRIPDIIEIIVLTTGKKKILLPEPTSI